MKNFWRIFILFMLPGAVLTGCSIISFFRLADSGFEPLVILSAAAVLWCFSAGIASWIALKLRNPSDFYYPAVLLMSVAFVCGSSVCRSLSPVGWLPGVIGIFISGAASAFIFQAFTGCSIKERDRWNFVLGGIASGCVFALALFGYQLSRVETFFFYLAMLLILLWGIASPQTVFGKTYKRYLLRAGLLAVLIGGFLYSPVFMFKPWNKTPDLMPDGVWSQTLVTAQGSRFIWCSKDDRRGVFTPDGRLLAWDTPDEDMFLALPALLGCVEKKQVDIKLVSNYKSAVPEAFEHLRNVRVDSFWIPDTLSRTNHKVSSYKVRQVPGDPDSPEGKYDLLIISSWYENQYPDAVQQQWKKLSRGIKKDAVIAVRGELLRNPAIFRLLHEKFQACGTLPGPCRLWIFSEKKLDVSVDAIDRNWQRFYDTMPGAVGMLYSNIYEERNATPAPETETLLLGNNRWFGSYWWFLAAAGLLILWRLIRLAGERRNIMYSFWNGMENGFAGMGTLLFGVGLLISCTGLPVAWSILLLVLAFLMSFRSWKFMGTSAALAAVAVIPAAVCLECWYLLAGAVFVQMCFTGSWHSELAISTPERRKLLCAMFTGMLFAAVLNGAMWLWNVPYMVVWLIFLLSRVPVFWQKSNKHVY